MRGSHEVTPTVTVAREEREDERQEDRGAPTERREPVLDVGWISAVLFDVDGVVTDTARVHAAAWKRAFDEYLREHAKDTGEAAEPFDIHDDYLRYVDGRPRLDGVRCFLAARGITPPEGEPGDSVDVPSVHGLGRRKDEYFLARLRRHGVAAFPPTIRLLHELRRRGVGTAAVSASRNAGAVLQAAGVDDLFDVTVDGRDAARLGLPGKPDPALYCEAAHRLDTPPRHAAVIEDALAGVEAGRRGHFGLVVGLGRDEQAEDLLRSGADVVVDNLGQLPLVGRARRE